MTFEQSKRRVESAKKSIHEQKEILKKAGLALTEVYLALEGHLLHNDPLDEKSKKDLLREIKNAGDEIDEVITAMSIEERGL